MNGVGFILLLALEYLFIKDPIINYIWISL